MNRTIPLALAVGAVAFLAISAQAQNPNPYTFTTFDVPFNGASNTKAFEINGAGVIVGRYVDSTTGGPRGFLRNSDGTYAPPIDVPVPNTGTVVRGIDSRGDLVGKYFDPNHPNATHGFVWMQGGGFTSFDVSLAGAIPGSTVANSINNVGQVVGRYAAPTAVPGCAGSFPLGHGFLRNADGSFAAINFPGPNVISTFAEGIDDSGNIVGSYITAPNPPSSCDLNVLVTAHGYLLDPKGNYTSIDPPASAGAMETAATRISDNGDITGVYVTVQVPLGQLVGDVPAPSIGPGSGFYFVLSTNGAFNSIPTPFAATGRQGPLGINPRSNLVGFYNDGTGDHGFLATK